MLFQNQPAAVMTACAPSEVSAFHGSRASQAEQGTNAIKLFSSFIPGWILTQIGSGR